MQLRIARPVLHSTTHPALPIGIRTHEQHLQTSHADVDFLGELKLAALLGALEQAAVEASARSGYDPARYAAEGRVWIVRRTRLERMAPIAGGDRLTISTRVADFRRARSLREYEVTRSRGYDGEGPARAVNATTDWVLCDAASGRPVSVPDEMRGALSGTAQPPTHRRAPPVVVPQDAPPPHAVRVRPSHLDHMLHVNNAVWADFLEDAALALFADHGWGIEHTLEQGRALRLQAIDLEYLGDAGLGQDLHVRSWLLGGPGPQERSPSLVQTIDRADGPRLLRAWSRWTWRTRSRVLGGRPT